jgi:hypothetical protein
LSQQASSRKDPDSGREVFRGAGSTVLSWAWFVVAVIILVDLAVQGRDHAALVTAVAVMAITGVVYSCAWRPRIVADSAGITIVNPLRDHYVGWTAVTKVDVVNAVRVHCEPGPDGARGKILYSWAVQSSGRSARKAALRRDTRRAPRPRLASRTRTAGPPPGQSPRYGEMPESVREAMERSPADFTAGRLAERAQHARQAAVVASLRAAGEQAPEEGPRPVGAPEAAEAGTGQAAGDNQVSENGQVAAGQATPGSGPEGDGPPAAQQAVVAAGVPVARWAWWSIAAMAVPVAALVLVALL